MKQKFKVLHNKDHGQESDLSVFDTQWEKVQMQTEWSLLLCYMTKTVESAASGDAENSNEH